MSIYLDNAATTKTNDSVAKEMIDIIEKHYGNSSSVYTIGRENKVRIENAREIIAKSLKCSAKEICFTSGGTESDNWAIKGVVNKYKHKGNHIITSKIEHHAVLHTFEYLEKNGFEVTYLDVDKEGFVNVDQFRDSIKENTIFASIMFANNEIGTIQPIKQLGQIARENGVIFHTDAVQAFGNLEINVEEMNIDLLSLSGHKIYGPKGIGALYIRKGILIEPLIHGGAQEMRRRGGTENVANIVGLGKAVQILMDDFEEVEKITYLRDKLIKGILENIPNSFLNGSKEKRLPGNVNISFEFIEGESILLLLDMKGIYASSGSACTSGSLDPSHVLLSLGLKHEEAHGSVRFSIGKYNTEEEIDYCIKELPPIIKRLREMSPLYNE